MRRLMLSVFAALSLALPAIAQEDLPDAPVAFARIDEDLVRWATRPISDSGILTLPATPMFEGVTADDVAGLADGWRLRSSTYAAFTGIAVTPEKPLSGPQGRFDSGGFSYSGPEPTNVLASDTIHGVVVETDSMLEDCDGMFREISVSLARPGLPTATASNEFVGDPGIGHNLVVAIAMRDCQVEVPYLELVDDGYQLFQTRVMSLFWDDGEMSRAAFFATEPTFDGDFTVTASQASIDDFRIETAFKQFVPNLMWADAEMIDGSGDATITLEETSALIAAPAAPPPGSTTSTSSASSTTSTSSASSTTSTIAGEAAPPAGGSAEIDGGFGPLWWIVGLIVIAVVGILGFYYVGGWMSHALASTIVIPSWFLLPEEYVWVVDGYGPRWIRREDVGKYRRDPYQPFVAIAAEQPNAADGSILAAFRIGGYRDRQESADAEAREGWAAAWGRFSGDWLRREMKPNPLYEPVEIDNEKWGRFAHRIEIALNRRALGFEKVLDEEGNELWVLDADPDASDSAEKAEVWVSEDEKVVFLVDDPQSLIDAIETDLETKPSFPDDDAIEVDDGVAPS